MTPYPPNPPENPYRRPVGQGFSATERRDNLVRGWDEGFLAADSWWRSRLVSDERLREAAGRLLVAFAAEEDEHGFPFSFELRDAHRALVAAAGREENTDA